MQEENRSLRKENRSLLVAIGARDILQTKNQELQKQRNALSAEIGVIRESWKKDKATFLYNLGVTQATYGLYPEAAGLFEQVLLLNPNDAGAHYNLGILYEEHLNQIKKGIAHYQEFLRLSKDEEKRFQVRNWIEVAKHHFSPVEQSDAESAKTAFKRLFFTHPSSS